MARILGGAMPQPYGAYDPGSGGPRMDLWFRKIMESMQGIKEQKAAKTEAGRKAGMEERRLEATEADVTLRREKFEKESEPMVVPPEMVQKISEHFKITPDTFQGYDRQVQIGMIGEVIRETGREGDREWKEKQAAGEKAERDARKVETDTERDRITLLGKHYGKLDTARKRVQDERTRVVNMFKSDYDSPGRSAQRQAALDKFDKYNNMLASMDGKLKMETPLDKFELKTLDQILEDIGVVRSGALMGGGLKKEMPEIGERRTITKGPDKGKEAEHLGNDEWRVIE